MPYLSCRFLYIFSERWNMNEKVLKSIGFPLKMLALIDTFAGDKNLSRADVVRAACTEYIKKNDLEKKYSIKMN